MKKLFVSLFLFCSLSAMGQVVQAPGGVNFGNGNLFSVSSGNGNPDPSCRSSQEYIQLDAPVGSNIWQCINGTMVQQGGGPGGGDVQGINGVILANLSSGILKNTAPFGKPSIAVPGIDYVIPSGTVDNVSGVVLPTNGGTGVSSPSGYAYGNGDKPFTFSPTIPYSAISGIPENPISSVFGRNGAIVATTGDYTVSQITGAAPLLNPIFAGMVITPSVTVTGLTPLRCVQTDSNNVLVASSTACGGGFSNPMTTNGDIIVGGSNGNPTRLASTNSNATSLLSQIGGITAWTSSTGTGEVVMDTNPTLINPVLGNALADSINGIVIDAFGNGNINVGTNNSCSGNYNLIFGSNALKSCVNSSSNIVIGDFSLLHMKNGNNIIAIGTNAGSDSSSGINDTANGSIYIGSDTIAKNNGDYNEIVIGNGAVGNGNNTITLGSSTNTDVFVQGNVNISGHMNQNGTNNIGGTCNMNNSTSCTFSLINSFNSTPICISSAQGIAPISSSCSVSGKLVTIYAGAANNETWGVIIVGNPN